MAEIRLICPGCAAEYRLPRTAIPPEGREVECSACGHVWHATVQPAGLAPGNDLPPPPAPADGPPRLSRRLPDTVLDILRDEVEHERRLRAAEEGTPPPPPPAAAPLRAADPEWPATTITTSIIPHVAPEPAEAAPLRPQPELIVPPEAHAQPVIPETKAAPQPARPLLRKEIAARPERPVPPAPVLVLVPRPARRGYAVGFGLAVTLAAACVALYLLAPALSGQGAFGDGVMQLRGQVDEARLWLQDRAAGLTR
ncbi:zinc-ribbon domain-containing protein [Paracoccus benzoatiresistens]|uniref:Zinc-ribbon domain-containing protein n=1 Tax=Paracoccus benzoatiresistens TaxID=2997341 RepID=A0ABT4J843_9RHOB|nr:zinc-ribbon domain-containing protein [Paracoccus sp. EF6]MCZ0962757.1 zinc-ribbon domain-containing protein [Paracoccus sp. EF6]